MRQVTDEVHHFQLSCMPPCALPSENAGIPVNRTPFSMIQNSSPSLRFLRFRQTQVRRLGIQAATDSSFPHAVVSMADRTMIREMQPRIAQIFLRG